MNKREALEWVREQLGAEDDTEHDDADLNAALRALGCDPAYLSGNEDDPTDRRWDTACDLARLTREGREGGFPGNPDDA